MNYRAGLWLLPLWLPLPCSWTVGYTLQGRPQFYTTSTWNRTQRTWRIATQRVDSLQHQSELYQCYSWKLSVSWFLLLLLGWGKQDRTQVFTWVRQSAGLCLTLPPFFNILTDFGGKTILPSVILVRKSMLYFKCFEDFLLLLNIV